MECWTLEPHNFAYAAVEDRGYQALTLAKKKTSMMAFDTSVDKSL